MNYGLTQLSVPVTTVPAAQSASLSLNQFDPDRVENSDCELKFL